MCVVRLELERLGVLMEDALVGQVLSRRVSSNLFVFNRIIDGMPSFYVMVDISGNLRAPVRNLISGAKKKRWSLMDSTAC